MTRLTDEQFAKLERALSEEPLQPAANPKIHYDISEYGEAIVWHEDDEDAEPMSHSAYTNLFKEMLCAVRAIQALLAELRALRAVRDAAERYREAFRDYVRMTAIDSPDSHEAFKAKENAFNALFASLDAATSEEA